MRRPACPSSMPNSAGGLAAAVDAFTGGHGTHAFLAMERGTQGALTSGLFGSGGLHREQLAVRLRGSSSSYFITRGGGSVAPAGGGLRRSKETADHECYQGHRHHSSRLLRGEAARAALGGGGGEIFWQERAHTQAPVRSEVRPSQKGLDRPGNLLPRRRHPSLGRRLTSDRKHILTVGRILNDRVTSPRRQRQKKALPNQSYTVASLVHSSPVRLGLEYKALTSGRTWPGMANSTYNNTKERNNDD